MLLLLSSVAFAEPALDRLKSRDAVDCASLGEATPALRDELLALTDPALLPATVPMRATACLVERFAADGVVQAAFTAWLQDPTRPGEVLVVLGHEAALPEAFAAELVRGALAAPNARVAAKARSVAARSPHAPVNALLK